MRKILLERVIFYMIESYKDGYLNNLDNRVTNINNDLNSFITEVNTKLGTLLKQELLWTNPSQSSNFAPQNITLSKSCEKIDIIFRRSTSDTNEIICTVYNMNAYTECFGTSSRGKLLKRMIALSNNTVMFADGLFFNTYGSAAVDNSMMIPIRIIGYTKLS